MLSDDGDTVHWRAEPGLWGRLDRLERASANDNCPIRFQGQWEGAESGLYYNRYRYYDPDAAQYLTPDPIGLAGGIRPHGYVDDPNEFVDPLGLAGCATGGANATPGSNSGQQRHFWVDDPIEFKRNRVYQCNDQFDPNKVSTWKDQGKLVQGTNL